MPDKIKNIPPEDQPKRPWTDAEIKTLQQYAPVKSPVEIQKSHLPHRTLSAIHTRMSMLDIHQSTQSPNWTNAEIQYLIKNYPTTPPKEMSQQLGRTMKAIQGKAERLGLRREKKPRKNQIGQPWEPEEDDIIRKHKSTATCEEIHQRFLPERTPSAIRKRAQRLGQTCPAEPWSEEELQIMMEKYPLFTMKALRRLLPKRTPNAINMKAVELNLHK